MMQWWHAVLAAVAAAESKVQAGLPAVLVVARAILVDSGKKHLVLCVHCVDAPPVRMAAHLMSLGTSQEPASMML